MHPVDQVRGYCNYLRQSMVLLHDRPEAIHGVAYLYNATRQSVSALFARVQDDLGRMFTGDQYDEFIAYLRSQFAPAPGAAAADLIIASEIRHRKTLSVRFAVDDPWMVAERSLPDSLKLAYESVMNRIRLVSTSTHKSVILVTGGPGSGRSLIAVSLLAELYRAGRRVRYASGSSAVIETMRKFRCAQSPELRKLFTYYKQYAAVEPNALDVLICDEAHGIRRTSANRFSQRGYTTERPQIDELMTAARVPIFLLDEHEIVRPDQVGTVDLIMDHAARSGFPVFHIKLDGQFRVGGSAAFDEWVLRLLGIRAGGPTVWTGDDFEVRVARSPQEMEDFLRIKHNQGETARMAAGYCWPWSDTRDDGSLVSDIVIGDWSKPWNKRDNRITGSAPPATLWATDPRGFEQIGCVYTVQGFEFDWAGVIIGPDIAIDSQHLTVTREFNVDPGLKGSKENPILDEDFEALVRNVYKVLLTRGMRGVVIYAVDSETQDFLTGLVGPGRSMRIRETDTSKSAWAPQGSRVQKALVSLSENIPDFGQAFLCHSSGDKAAVRDLYQKLLREGFRPWLDVEELIPGQDWEYEIRQAIESSDVVVVCLSESSITKTGFVQKEISIALDAAERRPEGEIYLIPTRLEPCSIPRRLSRWHRVDLFDSDGYGRLTEAIRRAARGR